MSPLMNEVPRILVTGAMGFIGSRVSVALLRRGAAVIALARSGSDQRRLLSTGAKVSVVDGDYHVEQDIRRGLEQARPTILVHSAWRIDVGTAYLHAVSNLADVRASLRLFEMASELGCRRIVAIGTCLEYEESDGPVPETTALRPKTLYAASKAALYLAARAWAQTTGVEFAWARLYYPFGPGEPRHRLIPAVVNGILAGKRVATTDGRQRQSFLHVDDVGDAIAALALSTACDAFNVASGEATSVRDLVVTIAERLRGTRLLDIGSLASRADEPRVLWGDVTRLRRELGWRPTRSLDEALDDTIEWWRTTDAHAS